MPALAMAPSASWISPPLEVGGEVALAERRRRALVVAVDRFPAVAGAGRGPHHRLDLVERVDDERLAVVFLGEEIGEDLQKVLVGTDLEGVVDVKVNAFRRLLAIHEDVEGVGELGGKTGLANAGRAVDGDNRRLRLLLLLEFVEYGHQRIPQG